MIFHRHIPSNQLSKYVECIVYIEGNNKGVGFPKNSMSLAFNLHDSFKLYGDSCFLNFVNYKKYWVAGIQTKPSYIENYGNSKMVVVQFKNLGAHVFLKQPLKYFMNSYIDLDQVFGREADEVWDRLLEAETPAEKFSITESFLNGKLSECVFHEKLKSCIEHLAVGKNSVSSVCKHHGISRKHLNSLFQEYVGVSPKLLSSLHRFQNILQVISKSKPNTLTTLAHELDFFDQAHFNNNFRRFTGINPNEYIRSIGKNPSLKLVPHFLPAE